MDFTDLGPAMSAAEGRDANVRVKELEKIVAELSERVAILERKNQQRETQICLFENGPNS